MASQTLAQKEKGPVLRGRRPFLTIAGLWLISLAALVLAHPNPLIPQGFFPLAYLAPFTLLLAVRRMGYGLTFLAGGLFSSLFYLLHNFWLLPFHPLTIIIVPLLAVFIVGPLFPLLKLMDRLFPRYGFLAQTALWVFYEYLRTQGFLGYSFGLMGYSQYRFLPLIQVARWTGFWGVSFLVILPGAYGAACAAGKGRRWMTLAVSAVFVLNLALGGLQMLQWDRREPETRRIALIQPNTNAWRTGVEAYREVLNDLIRLSLEAEKQNPDMVVWSETAFVPAIDYHTQYRPHPPSYRLVKELLEFMEGRDIPYVIGNDDGQKRILPDGSFTRIDYNAALLFEGGEITERYRKRHLVPFTEYFPYGHIFPRLKQLLIDTGTHFWEKGDDWTVFEAGGIRFATPICFEDNFGYISRAFVQRGADLLMVLTNDGWSGSAVTTEQHLQIGVFRAVENGRSMVRSTNTGVTAAVDADGRILERLEAMEEGVLVASVPVYTEGRTLYNRWGNWFPWLLAFGILSGMVYSLVSRRRKRAD